MSLGFIPPSSLDPTLPRHSCVGVLKTNVAPLKTINQVFAAAALHNDIMCTPHLQENGKKKKKKEAVAVWGISSPGEEEDEGVWPAATCDNKKDEFCGAEDKKCSETE